MTRYDCPSCLSEPFDTKNGAVMHMVNKRDDAHAAHDSKAAARDAMVTVENSDPAVDSTVPTGSTDSTTSAPEFPVSPDGPNPIGSDTNSSRDVDADALTHADGPAGASAVSTDDDRDDGDVDDARGPAGTGVVLLTAVGLAGAVAWRSLRRGGSQTTDDGGLKVV